jgi:hypothetical protein
MTDLRAVWMILPAFAFFLAAWLTNHTFTRRRSPPVLPISRQFPRPPPPRSPMAYGGYYPITPTDQHNTEEPATRLNQPEPLSHWPITSSPIFRPPGPRNGKTTNREWYSSGEVTHNALVYMHLTGESADTLPQYPLSPAPPPYELEQTF